MASAAGPTIVAQPQTALRRWRDTTRVVFRFCVVYFTLWALATQVVGGLLQVPGHFLPALGPLWPMADITQWTALHMFGVEAPFERGNSGDTVFWWTLTAWLLAFSVVATGVWSALDRRRTDYVTLHKWFVVFIRFLLAAQMFYYGMAKVIPIQFMPPAGLFELLG